MAKQVQQPKKLAEAKIKFVMRYPFFAGLLCRRTIVLTTDVPTAAVNDKGTIFFNPDFLKKLTIDETMFVLAHECMHVVFAHRPRSHGRDHMVWNIAGDAVINHMLTACHVGKPIDGMVQFDWVEDTTTAEEVYDKLMQKGKKNPDSGAGSGSGAGGAGGAMSVNDLTDKTPEEGVGSGKPSDQEIAAAIQQGKLEIAAAYQAEKLRGAGGGALGGIVEAILSEKVPWHELLERYMTGKQRCNRTWARPSKRYLRTAYLPGKTHAPSMGKIVLGIDTSGSVSDEEMSEFLGHLARICEVCDPESVDVLFTTSKVEHVDHYERGDYEFEKTANRWCGGTDMRAVTRWTEEHCDDADVVIIFTDGYTPFPTEAPCDVLWVFTTDATKDPDGVGEVFYL